MASERLKEVVVLATSNQLDREKVALIEDQFDKHASSIAEDIKTFEDQGQYDKALEVSSQFTATLKESQSSLSIISSETTAGAASLDTIAETVEENIETSVAAREKTEDAVETAISASTIDTEQIKVIAEKKRAEAVSLIATLPVILPSASSTNSSSSAASSTTFSPASPSPSSIQAGVMFQSSQFVQSDQP